MLGFAASTGAMIRVGSSTPFQRVQLRRLDGAVSPIGTAEAPVKARPIIAAGFELPRGGEGDVERLFAVIENTRTTTRRGGPVI